ncbi:apicoplast ribosomal protein L29 precursor, putative [Plasmodium reichenowi]|uniref:Apicoplast ribosomal protein L29, putative n=1 Tax=Plasmodium reichenowi TaxID=5854 RepID=A0A060RV61_PLARE|nr:apicoplast ribosomal protein L29 precursor, putative [Plasmodium reichenowi]
MKQIFWYFLFFFLIKIYRVNGVHIKGRCVSFINNKLNIINHKTYKSTNPLFCYKKRVKAKELRKLTTEELEKEIIKCRLDIQKFQQQGFYDIHNYNVFYEKNARRKLAQLLTIYYQRYLDNNIRIKS